MGGRARVIVLSRVLNLIREIIHYRVWRVLNILRVHVCVVRVLCTSCACCVRPVWRARGVCARVSCARARGRIKENRLWWGLAGVWWGFGVKIRCLEGGGVYGWL